MASPGDLSRGQLLGLAIPILLVLALAAALAVQVLDADRSHREAVQRTLHDYGDFAAHIVASGAWQEMERRLLYAFAPLRIWREGEPLPVPAALGRDPAESRRCSAEADSMPIFARAVLPAGPIETAGREASAPVLRWLADTLLVVAAAEPEGETRFGHIIDPRRDGAVWAYAVLRGPPGGARAIYAKTSCLSSDGISIFQRALADRPALPPVATGGLSNDSLLVVLVEDAAGNPIWQSDAVPADTLYASGSLVWPRLGGVRVRAFLRPAAARSLVIGGMPTTRLPMALLLFLLATAFTGLAIVQVRRQQVLIRARERFVANVSHELRTPLQQILVFAELLRMGRLRSEEERQHSLQVVERETHRLILLVDNVLGFSRKESMQAPLAAEEFDVAAVAAETVHAFRPLAATTDARIMLDAEPARAKGDADATRRALINLLDNAVKYGPRSQTIRVTVRPSERGAFVSVDDEGPGIPPAEREKVWRPFHRLERDELGNVAGSGMGLSIVHDVITRMGGTVRIEDVPGGTRFIFELPAASASRARRPDHAARNITVLSGDREGSAHHAGPAGIAGREDTRAPRDDGAPQPRREPKPNRVPGE